jgi:hypothetical protein
MNFCCLFAICLTTSLICAKFSSGELSPKGTERISKEVATKFFCCPYYGVFDVVSYKAIRMVG